MARKNRVGLQIRFNPESEQDLIEFFSPLKKAEVHITAISAFRMYMRSIGFYERKRYQDHHLPVRFSAQKEIEAKLENEGVFDEEALKTLNSMFDRENNFIDQGS